MIRLSKRLECIASYVCDGMNIVDIGCDHALLDIYLVQMKKNIKIIASDINKNALENAKKNIKKYHFEGKIKTCLSNGLENIDTSFLDTIIISGMGAHTMTGILYQNVSKLKNINTLILQSNNDLDFLRQKVVSLGYYISDEMLVEDGGIIYTIVVFKRGFKRYSKKAIYFGPVLLRKRDSLFIRKCKEELGKLEGFYPLIPKGHLHHKMITRWKIKQLNKIIME